MAAGIAGIILAGGLSRRMGGGDKPLLTLAGRPLIAKVVARLAPQVETLALNANGDAARFSDLGLPVFCDTVEGHAGPLAGILAGMEWTAANTGCEAVVSAAGDTPFFPRDLVIRLRAAVSGTQGIIAVAASEGRRHPTFAVWPIALRGALRRFLVEEDKRRVAAFIDGNEHVEVGFPLESNNGEVFDPFFNINTPADLEHAERLARNLG